MSIKAEFEVLCVLENVVSGAQYAYLQRIAEDAVNHRVRSEGGAEYVSDEDAQCVAHDAIVEYCTKRLRALKLLLTRTICIDARADSRELRDVRYRVISGA